MDYFSGLDKQDTSHKYEAVQHFKLNDSVAFVHNIELQDILPHDYLACDVLYSEVPWAKGYEKFNYRAGYKGTSFKKFMEKVKEIIEQNKNKAIVLVLGRSVLHTLPTPQFSAEVGLNGYKALAVIYNMTEQDFNSLDTTDHETLLRSLAKRYSRIGDFCCGYGSAGRIFLQHGKSFVMSDMNAHCIGYIKQTAKEWQQ